LLDVCAIPGAVFAMASEADAAVSKITFEYGNIYIGSCWCF
jgi:hypothetical protein